MSDGREEREEREKRREQEERENREDRINRNHVAEWEQERVGLLKCYGGWNCCRRKRLRGLAEATRIDLAEAAVTISPERGDGASGGLQLRPFFPIRLLEDRPSLKRNVELSPTGHNWTA